MKIHWDKLYGRKRFKSFQEEEEAKNPPFMKHPLIVKWQAQKKILSVADKIELLRKIAEIKNPINRKKYKRRRKVSFGCNKICFVCKLNKAFYHHHVLPLISGGRNKENNRIPICDSCHREVHPWMGSKTKFNSIDKEFENIVRSLQ